MAPDEKIAALQTVKEFEEGKFIAMGTLRGIVKKTELSAFSNPRAGGIIAMGVEDGDRLMAAQITDGTGEIFIGTRDGLAIRFPEGDVRPMGRTAYGVKGITLREGDEVVAMEVVRPGSTLLTVTEHGYGKRTELDEYRVQSRGGVGIINIQTTERNGRVVGMASVHDEDEFMLITQQGKILRTVARDIRTHRAGNAGCAPDRDRRGRPGRSSGPARGKRRRERLGRHRARLKTGHYDRLHRTSAAKEEAGMFRPKTSVYLLAPMVLAVAALSACSSPNASEENLVRQFFRASGLRDNQTLANFATVSFDPKTEGHGDRFRGHRGQPRADRTAARHRAVDKARQPRRRRRTRRSTKRRRRIRTRTCEAIDRVLKAESAGRKLTGKDAQIQAEWTKWRDETQRRSEEGVGRETRALRRAPDRGAEPDGQFRRADANRRRAERHARVEGHLRDGDGSRRRTARPARRTT